MKKSVENRKKLAYPFNPIVKCKRGPSEQPGTLLHFEFYILPFTFSIPSPGLIPFLIRHTPIIPARNLHHTQRVCGADFRGEVSKQRQVFELFEEIGRGAVFAGFRVFFLCFIQFHQVIMAL